ncbi:hypothetical protein LTR50_004176 [Elasticomyces elasticus]|nr:hypothetical protein LTR50_004176 [Elasticomyces elasticus]
MFTQIYALLALATLCARLTTATPPACLLGAVNSQPQPGQLSAVCGNATSVEASISSLCKDNIGPAMSAFSDVCKSAGVTIAIATSSASGTASTTSSTSATGTGTATRTASTSNGASSTSAGIHTDTSSLTRTATGTAAGGTATSSSGGTATSASSTHASGAAVNVDAYGLAISTFMVVLSLLSHS